MVTCIQLFSSGRHVYVYSCLCPSAQVALDHEKKTSNELRQKYAEEQEVSEERRKKLEETESKAHHLQESMQR